jgi:hypothetical protein
VRRVLAGAFIAWLIYMVVKHGDDLAAIILWLVSLAGALAEGIANTVGSLVKGLG